MSTETKVDRKAKTLSLVQVSLFSALIIIMAFTPFLGYIPLGFTRATIIHIPVILGAIMLGPKQGALLGFIFGMTSFINNTMNPTVTSFVFTPFYNLGEMRGGIGSIIICFLPRILVGVFPFFVYKFCNRMLQKKQNGSNYALAIAGLIGSLTNTLLVMNLIFVFFKDSYAAANGIATESVYAFILSIIGMNGVPEAIVAAVLVSFVGRVLLKVRRV